MEDALFLIVLKKGAGGPGPLRAIGTPITNALVNSAYAGFDVDAVNGTAPYTFSLVGTWPTGITINSSSGIVSGTPTVQGTYTGLSVRVTDNVAATHDLPTFSIVVSPALSIVATPTTTGKVGDAFVSFSAVASGGTGTGYVYGKSGTWPTGIDISPTTGAVGGTPTNNGSFTSLRCTVTDSGGNSAQTTTFTITISPADLIISGTPVTTGFINEAYAGFTVGSTGGVAPYTYSLRGTWPTGISIGSSSGIVSGTPTQSGSFTSLNVRVTDSLTTFDELNSTFTLTVAAALAIIGTPVTTGSEGTAYGGFTCSATGGAGGYVFTAIGSWPAGLSVHSSTGVVSGTPTTAGTYASLTVRVTDAGARTSDLSSFTITVASADAFAPWTGGSATTLSLTSGSTYIRATAVDPAVTNPRTWIPFVSGFFKASSPYEIETTVNANHGSGSLIYRVSDNDAIPDGLVSFIESNDGISFALPWTMPGTDRAMYVGFVQICDTAGQYGEALHNMSLRGTDEGATIGASTAQLGSWTAGNVYSRAGWRSKGNKATSRSMTTSQPAVITRAIHPNVDFIVGATYRFRMMVRIVNGLSTNYTGIWPNADGTGTAYGYIITSGATDTLIDFNFVMPNVANAYYGIGCDTPSGAATIVAVECDFTAQITYVSGP